MPSNREPEVDEFRPQKQLPARLSSVPPLDKFFLDPSSARTVKFFEEIWAIHRQSADRLERLQSSVLTTKKV